MKYSVCLLPTSVHTQCFAEIADSVAWGLEQLGHEVERSVAIDPELPVIVFGLRAGDRIDRPSKGVIIYNGEQCTPGGMWPGLIDLYKKHVVWDYSAANAGRYERWGLRDPAVVPPGYAEPLVGRIPPSDRKPYDVAFFGSRNPRRDAVLNLIEQRGAKVLRVPFGIYGAERDQLLAQSKLCINIHFYDDPGLETIFESVRCSYLTMNGLMVITEASAEKENEIWSIQAAPVESLADTVMHLLDNPEDLEVLRLVQHERSKQVSIVEFLSVALERLEQDEENVASDVSRAPVSDGVQNAQGSDGVQVRAQSGQLVPELTLSMIVKNEAGIIERCLASVKPYLKRWCIMDTGSTDGTQEVIRKFMDGVPGTLHERPWKEYDGSRTEAMDLARAECGEQGYVLLIDADEQLQLTGDLVLTGDYDCYDGWVTRCDGCSRWGRPLLVRASKPWFYMMPRHEGLYCHVESRTAPSRFPNARILSGHEGARAKEGDRFLRDARVLEEWLLKHPGHSRCQYYIAQSYRDAATNVSPPDRALMQKALMSYQKRAKIPVFPAEAFSAMLQAADAMAVCGYPWERVQQTYLEAWAFRPGRAEPLYLIGRYYRELKQYQLAEIFLRRAAVTVPEEDFFPDFDQSIYDWKSKEELATVLTWISGYQEALQLFTDVIQVAPPMERQRIQDNIDTCRRMLGMPAPGGTQTTAKGADL